MIIDEKKSNYGLAAIIYAVLFFFAGTFILIFLTNIFSNIHQVDKLVIIEGLAATDYSNYTETEILVLSKVNGWGNLVIYLLSLIGIIVFLKHDIKEDIKDFIQTAKSETGLLFAVAFGFLVVTYVVDIIVSQFVPVSENQNTIVQIFTGGGALPMVIATVILAPIVEEYIYRKCVFALKPHFGKGMCYVVSILAFTLPHMLSTPMDDIFTWIIQCVPYATSGFLLCLIYDNFKENTCVPIVVHMLNNLVATLLVFMVV